MRVIGIIPARYEASRLPGKPLLEIDGRPMIEHVYRRASCAPSLAEVWVATDDERVLRACAAFGGKAMLTREDHRSGTDRLAEAVAGLAADVVVNVQGDEPLLDPETIEAVVAPLRADPSLQMATVATPIRERRDEEDPSVVKVVLDRRGHALYFSRLPIPYYRDVQRDVQSPPRMKHLGLYAYRREFLLGYPRMDSTPLEQAECLEQLRALEHGHRIGVGIVEHDAVSVDTPLDLTRVRATFAAAREAGNPL
jgi:3-deoxy-manno-octulosonate cytidylyltransferase (CMP-KDO synthetase)